jgi:hypothetical protein
MYSTFYVVIENQQALGARCRICSIAFMGGIAPGIGNIGFRRSDPAVSAKIAIEVAGVAISVETSGTAIAIEASRVAVAVAVAGIAIPVAVAGIAIPVAIKNAAAVVRARIGVRLIN